MALGVEAPLVLARLRALDRWPQPAVYLWLAATTGALGVVLLLLMPTASVGIGLAELLRTCVVTVRVVIDAPRGGSGAWVGLGLVGMVVGGLGGWAVGRQTRRLWRLHRDLFALAGRAEPGLPGVTVLQHPAVLAYCLPGRDGPVVLSSVALERLEPGHLEAVVAHERAHQAGRHHGLVLAAEVLQVGFPWLPAARMGRPAVGRLVELAADVAARSQGERRVADALARLGATPTRRPCWAPAARRCSSGSRACWSRHLAEPARRCWLACCSCAARRRPVVAVIGPLARVAGAATCPVS